MWGRGPAQRKNKKQNKKTRSSLCCGVLGHDIQTSQACSGLPIRGGAVTRSIVCCGGLGHESRLARHVQGLP
jgi:hypothetical protein